MMKFKVDGQIISIAEISQPVADSVDCLTAEFEFSGDWDSFSTRTAYFQQGTTRNAYVLSNDKITASKHLNLTAGNWEVSVVGIGASNNKITSNTVSLAVLQSGIRGGSSITVTASASDQIVSKVSAINDSVNSFKNDSLLSKGTLPSGTDFDTVKENAVYYVGSGTYVNKPHPTSIGFLYVNKSGSYVVQTFITSSYIWSRRFGSSWTDWLKLAVDSQITEIYNALDKANAYNRARLANNLIQSYIPTANRTKNGCVWSLGSDGYTISITSESVTATNTSLSLGSIPLSDIGLSVGDVFYGEFYGNIGSCADNEDRMIHMQVRFLKSDDTEIESYYVVNGIRRFTVPSETSKLYVIIYDRGLTSGSTVDDSVCGVGIYKDSASPTLTMRRLDEIDNADPLKGKVWVHCGDSFSAGSDVPEDCEHPFETFESGMYTGKKKTYPFLIASRAGMTLKDGFFKCGRTLAYPGDASGFENSITCSKVDSEGKTRGYYYQKIPENVDYVTFQLGINDEHHRSDESAGDGESNIGRISLGTIDSTDTSTYYGAWNVVLTWLRTNRPFAHVGIIVTNGLSLSEYREAQINIAKKYGIPYIDLNGDERTPAMIRSVNTNIPDSIKSAIKAKQAFDPDGSRTGTVDNHPNESTHEFQSRFIEAFLRSI